LFKFKKKKWDNNVIHFEEYAHKYFVRAPDILKYLWKQFVHYVIKIQFTLRNHTHVRSASIIKFKYPSGSLDNCINCIHFFSSSIVWRYRLSFIVGSNHSCTLNIKYTWYQNPTHKTSYYTLPSRLLLQTILIIKLSFVMCLY